MQILNFKISTQLSSQLLDQYKVKRSRLNFRCWVCQLLIQPRVSASKECNFKNDLWHLGMNLGLRLRPALAGSFLYIRVYSRTSRTIVSRVKIHNTVIRKRPLAQQEDNLVQYNLAVQYPSLYHYVLYWFSAYCEYWYCYIFPCQSQPYGIHIDQA